MLTTEEIVARLQPRRMWRPPRQTVPLVGAGLVVMGLCYGVARFVAPGEVPSGGHPAPSVWASLPSAPLAEDLRAEEAASHVTPVSVHLSRPGSMFVDGRRLGMQRHYKLTLTPGTHVVMVRFGSKSFRRTVRVGVLPLVLHCDAQRGFGPPPVPVVPHDAADGEATP